MLKNIVLIVGTLLGGILLGDGLFRVYEYAFLSVSYQPKGPVVDLQAFNYNDTTVAKEKPADQFRILGFGDSFCYSVLQYPYSYHGVAADILARTFPDRTFRLVNFGEPSTAFYQYIQAIDNWTSLVASDAVVVNVFLGNDITDVALGGVPDDLPINKVASEMFLDSQTGRKRLNAVPHVFGIRMLDYAYAYGQMFLKAGHGPKQVPEHYTFALESIPEDKYFRTMRQHAMAGEPARCGEMARGWQALADLARRLDKLAREQGIKVAIMLSPSEIMVDDALRQATAARAGLPAESIEPDLPDRLARRIVAAVAPNVPVLDLLPVLRCAAARGDREYNVSETHWNEAGNRLVGQALARFVATTWLGGTAPAEADADACLAMAPPLTGPVPADPVADACLAGVAAANATPVP